MDTTEITHLSLCSGYGGIDLGLKRVIPNLRTVAYAEIEAFAVEVLLARMEGGQLDAAPIWSNLKTFPWEQFSGLVDILSGGYPCQPFSTAGKRAGADDPRHLWPFISAGIAIMRPSLCFFENVEGHISLGLPDVIEDLGRLGYRTSWGIFSAAECGAPHQRKRVFILAHRKDIRLPQLATIRTAWKSLCSVTDCNKLANGNQQRLERSVQQGITSEKEQDEFIARCSGTLADTNSTRNWQDWKSSKPRATSVEQSSCFERRGDAGEVRERQVWPSRPGQPQHTWEPPRVVGNARRNGWRQDQQGRESKGRVAADGAGESMGNAEQQHDCGQIRANELSSGHGGIWPCGESFVETDRQQRQIEPTLGGDANGTPSGLDYAELCVTCDNRTDELRLLGNGVVPATATIAFKTLLAELQ